MAKTLPKKGHSFVDLGLGLKETQSVGGEESGFLKNWKKLKPFEDIQDILEGVVEVHLVCWDTPRSKHRKLFLKAKSCGAWFKDQNQNGDWWIVM